MSRLDDTSRCPQGKRCECCGCEEDLAIATAESQIGVHCVTVCEACEDRPLPRLNVNQTADRVLRHCEHTGLTLDDMATLMKAQDHGIGD